MIGAMNEAIGAILPLGVVVGLSPVPIIAVVLMLATPRARANGLAFLIGWLGGLTLVGTVVLLVSGAISASDDSEPATWVSVLLLVLGLLLILLALKQWRGRPRGDEDATLPKWMTTIDSFTPPKALGFGVLLSSVNPKNLMVTVAAAAAIAATGIDAADEMIALAVFILIGTIGVGGPVVLYLALGERSRKLLDGIKSWMAANNAAIMAVITLVIGAKLLGDGISGL
jgi:threonine/homoserine/homoserine lactone efflux protein